jgi:hypothetical protein
MIWAASSKNSAIGVFAQQSERRLLFFAAINLYASQQNRLGHADAPALS